MSKSKVLLSSVLCSVLLLVSGCSAKTAVSTTFTVETGDTVKVEYDTTDSDYSMYTEGADFYVGIKGGKPVVSGCFATKDAWEYYSVAASQADDATVYETVSVDGDESIYYSVDSEVGMQYIKIFRVHDSNTYIILASLEDQPKFEEEVARLSFEVK